MKEQIEKMYIQALIDALPPNVFANQVLRLFDAKRGDSPKCDKCGADETKQSCLGKWEDGEEYICDECGNEWEFHHFA